MSSGDILIFIGIALVIAGLLWKAGIKFGSLPGDIKIEKGTFRFYFPITTCVVISILLTLVFIIYRYLRT